MTDIISDEHWRQMFPENEFIHYYQLPNGEATVKIKDVKKEVLTIPGGAKKETMVITFDKKQPNLFGCNKTNAEAIEKVLGTANPKQWIGKEINLYATKCKLGKDTKDCIRVRGKQL
jgi:hypothetical protein